MQTSAAVQETRRLAQALLPAQAQEFSAQITQRVLHCVPDLAPAGDIDSVAVVHESTRQNVGALLATMAFGITPNVAEPPAGTRELIDNLVAAGGDVTYLLHAYRAGHQVLWQLWSEHVYACISDAALLPAVLAASSTHMFEFIDQTCQVITAVAPATADGEGARSPSDRLAAVALLLGSGHANIAAAASDLGYELSGDHLGFVASAVQAHADVRGELERLLARTTLPALVVPARDGRWWGWLGCPSLMGDQTEAQLAAASLTGVVIGVGSAGRGREGFRTTHRQALQAHWVARLSSPERPGVSVHRNVEHLALLCNDPDGAQRFSSRILRDLARRDDTAQRLRATVRALLDCGQNRARAAALMHVHPKTIGYRVHQAEALLGRTLSESTFRLQAALIIDEALHGP